MENRTARQEEQVITLSSSSEDESQKPIVTYPKTGRGVTLYPSDIERLTPGAWLNDRIINVMLKWSYDTELSPGRQKDTRVCDNFWYAGLVRGEVDPSVDRPLKNFERVRERSKAGEPFDRGLTLLPICSESHWYLIAVVREEVNTTRNFTIIYVDSLLRQKRRPAVEIVARYLVYANPGASVSVHQPAVKQQTNMDDCGVYLLTFAARFMRYISENAVIEENTLRDALNAEPCPVSRLDVRRAIFRLRDATEPTPATTSKEHVAPPMVKIAHPQQPNATTTDIKEHAPPPITQMTPSPQPAVTSMVMQPRQVMQLGDRVRLINRASESWALSSEDTDAYAEEIKQCLARQGATTGRHTSFKRTIRGQPIAFRVTNGTGACTIMRTNPSEM